MFFKTTSQRKSFGVTILLVITILFLLSFVGLKYVNPPIEFGMEVNFGSSDDGFGNELNINNKNDFNLNESLEKEMDVNDQLMTKTKTIKINDDKKTLNVINKKNDSSGQLAIKTENLIAETSVDKKQKISDNTKSILSNFTKKTYDKNENKGQGEDNEYFDNGISEGNPYSTIYYGQEGRGGKGVGYGLNGRNLQYQGKQVPKCNESGTVVVRIEVNQKGDVVSAKAGVKGTTNNDPCLLEPAKNTALMHKWFPDKNAPKKQIGFVVIQFKLVE
tara:strand:+ start:88 stop:912 length:825 start_codon:yes stop_codon:yes gene_type:complete